MAEKHRTIGFYLVKECTLQIGNSVTLTETLSENGSKPSKNTNLNTINTNTNPNPNPNPNNPFN